MISKRRLQKHTQGVTLNECGANQSNAHVLLQHTNCTCRHNRSPYKAASLHAYPSHTQVANTNSDQLTVPFATALQLPNRDVHTHIPVASTNSTPELEA